MAFLVSGVRVFISPKIVICKLQEASNGTLLCKVIVIVFVLQGQGELCPMLPLNVGPKTEHAAPLTTADGTGIPEPLMLT